MHASIPADALPREHLCLLTAYGQAQLHCTALVRTQAREIEALQAQLVRLRGQLLQRDTLLAWLREDRPARPGALDAATACGNALNSDAPDTAHELPASAEQEAEPELPADLLQAHLVICQTGCVSHDHYWRAQSQCRRTGDICLLATQPDALAAFQQPALPDILEK